MIHLTFKDEAAADKVERAMQMVAETCEAVADRNPSRAVKLSRDIRAYLDLIIPKVAEPQRTVGTIGHTAPPGFGPMTDFFRAASPIPPLERLRAAQEPLGAEFEKLLVDNLQELYVESPLHEHPVNPAQSTEGAEPLGLTGLLGVLEEMKFHPSASHVQPDYRDGYNHALANVVERIKAEVSFRAASPSTEGAAGSSGLSAPAGMMVAAPLDEQTLIETAITRATGEHRVLNSYDYEDVFACVQESLNAARAAVSGDKPSEPCPRGDQRPEKDCTNRHQCWEPCGELGHSMEHAIVDQSAGDMRNSSAAGDDAALSQVPAQGQPK